jgi:competence protein ComEC
VTLPTSASPIDDRQWTARPALPVAVMLAAGIAFHRLLPCAPGAWLALIAGCWAAAGLLIHRPRVFAALALPAVALLGVASAQLFESYFPRDHIALFATDEPRLVVVEARVDEQPRDAGSSRGRNVPPRVQFEATVLRIQTDSGWENATGKVQVSLAQTMENLAAGRMVRLVGMLQRPLSADNPGQFDWSAYGRTQRLLAEISVAHASGAQLLPGGGHGAGWSPLAWLRQHMRAAMDAGFPIASATDQQLLAALVFGDRGPDLQDVTEAFRRTGTTHLLASNGLRIAVLAAGLYLLCRCFFLPPRKSVWIVTGAVAIFSFLTLPAPQAIRPALLCAAVGTAIATRRRADSIQLLSLAAIFLLAFNPLDLYGAGFQLSFVTVLGLMLFAGPVGRWIGELENPHTRAARGLRQHSVWQQLRWVVWDRGRQLFAAAVVAWLIATPLVAYQFEQFNPWSIPIGILLSPLVFIAMIAGFAKVCLTLAIPALAGSWAAIAEEPAAMVRHAVVLLARIPGCDVPITSPSRGIIAGYYLLLCAPALASLAWFQRFRDRIKPAWPPAGIQRWFGRTASPAIALVLLFLPVGRAQAPRGVLQLTLLSVGAGQTAVVELPNGHTVLFDCGSSTLSDDLRQCLAPFLRHEGRSRIDAIYLSHGDYDHISAAAGAASDYDVHDIFISPNFRVHARESATAQGLLETLDHLGHPAQDLWIGRHIDLGDGATLDVLFPPEKSELNSNNSPLVLRLSYAGRSILFPADIQVPAESALLKNPGALASDVLVAPHHGSFEETTGRFIAAVHPQYILSSNAKRLTQKQREFDHLQNAHPLYRTSQCGALILTIDPGGRIDLRGFLRLKEERKIVNGE